MQILSGHVSPETAYVVDDYPYGFRLRCSIRYWLELKPSAGFRLVSQTTNPKRGNIWNKPKASTYARFGGCMYLDDAGHVQWSGLTEYSTGAEAQAWAGTYARGVPDAGRAIMEMWVERKLAYDARTKPGEPSITLVRKVTMVHQTTRHEIQCDANNQDFWAAEGYRRA